MVHIGPNRSKLLQIAPNCSKWLQVVPNPAKAHIYILILTQLTILPISLGYSCGMRPVLARARGWRSQEYSGEFTISLQEAERDNLLWNLCLDIFRQSVVGWISVFPCWHWELIAALCFCNDAIPLQICGEAINFPLQRSDAQILGVMFFHE